MDQAIEKLPTYQQSIGHALAFSSVEAACQMLEVMHLRGTLDICERDEEGYNVIDRFMERAPLCQPMIDTLEKIGATSAYTQPHKGRFIAMDRQVKWVKRSGGGKDEAPLRHESQGAHQKKPEQALACMIERVDGAWFDVPGHARGARQVARLVDCPRSAPLALAACWDRGIDPNVRKPNGTLAIAAMHDLQTFQEWAKAGGDVTARVSKTRDYPVWQSWADACHKASTSLKISADIKDALTGLVDEDQMHDACQFLAARSLRGNQSEMLKTLNTIDGWMHKRLYEGTPMWLEAVRLRPALMENLLDRKRAQPDFTQRGANGRSVWFAMLCCDNNELLGRVQSVAPIQQFGCDLQGRGLVAQVVAGYGGLPGLVRQNGKLSVLKGCLRQLNEMEAQYRKHFLDGVEGFTPDQLEGLDGDGLWTLALLFVDQPLVRARMGNEICLRLVDAMLDVCSDRSNMKTLTEQVSAHLQTFVGELVSRGCILPLDKWIERAKIMSNGWSRPIMDAGSGIHTLLKAHQAQLDMRQRTVEPAALPRDTARGTKPGRF